MGRWIGLRRARCSRRRRARWFKGMRVLATLVDAFLCFSFLFYLSVLWYIWFLLANGSLVPP